MNGKATCAILKQIRRDIAEKNDIALTIAECTHQGDCAGTCPRCEAEVRILEKALAEKKKKGLKTAVAGISAGLLAVGLSSCTPADKVGAQSLLIQFAEKLRPRAVDQLDGDMMPPDWEQETETEEAGKPCAVGEVEGEIPPQDPDDGEEYELAGDVIAEPEPEIGEEEYPSLAGFLAPDWELAETPDAP